MLNDLLVAPYPLTLSNPCWVQWVMCEAGRILSWSRLSALVGIAAHTRTNFVAYRALATTSGLIFEIPIRSPNELFDPWQRREGWVGELDVIS